MSSIEKHIRTVSKPLGVTSTTPHLKVECGWDNFEGVVVERFVVFALGHGINVSCAIDISGLFETARGWRSKPDLRSYRQKNATTPLTF